MENKLKELQDKFKNISLRTDLYFNQKFLFSQIQELEEEILILMQEEPTNKTILQINKYKKQMSIYYSQLINTRNQIKTINGKFN
jgi:hypothetical protein